MTAPPSPGDSTVGLTVEQRIGVAWRELRRGAAMRALRSELFGAGPDALDPGQVDTLDLVVAQGPLRMRDLAEAMRVDASTATRAVARLVEEGLVQRRPAPDDARAVVVAATSAGAARQARILERRRAFVEGVLAGFDATDRARLAELLERLVLAVDAMAAPCADPPSPGPASSPASASHLG